MTDAPAPYADLERIRADLAPGLRVLDGGKADGAKLPFLIPYAWRPPSEIPPRRWLYGKHYIREMTSATFAPGAAGKSALEIAEGLAMATGRPLLGVAPHVRCRVAYFNGEDPLEETERRLAAALLYFGIRPDEIEGWYFLGSGRDRRLVIAEQLTDGVIIRPEAREVEDFIRENAIDVLQIDPFVSSHAVQENDNNAIDKVAKEWGRVAGATGSAIELCHHTTKAAIGVEVRVEHGRGGGALLNAVRNARVLNTMTEEEAEAAGVPADERSWHFRTDNGKANLLPPGRKGCWFRFHSVELGNATEDYPEGDSIGVVAAWTWPGSGVPRRAPPPKLNYAAQRVLTGLRRLLDDQRGVTIPATIPGVRTSTKGVADADLRRMAADLGLTTEPRPPAGDAGAVTRWQTACRQAWKKGTEELVTKRVLRSEQGFWWELQPSMEGDAEER